MIKSEYYNRVLFEQSPIGLALTRMNGELVDVNPAFARIIGRSVEETLGLTYWELTPERYAAQEQEQLQSLTTNGRYGPYEKHYIHRDGHLVPVRLNGLLLEQQDETFIWSSVEDISSRVAAERALRESEQQFEALMHLLPGMFYRCVYDQGPAAVFASEGSREITGYCPDELIKRHLSCFALAHADDSHRVRDTLDSAVRQGHAYALEYRIVAADGKEKWIWDQGRVSADNDGKPVRLEGYVSDITGRKQAEQTIQHLADHDSLTGLVNRREFDRRLHTVLNSASGVGREHALLYIDLDRFKRVNDNCGHAAGDELLKQVSTLVCRRLRERDTLARLGGDEFGVLLENCQLDQAYAISLELIEAVADHQFIWEDSSFRLGASIGLVPLKAGIDSSTDLLRRADIACYNAKRKGRNCACIYNSKDERCFSQHSEARWIADIHNALEQNHFKLYAQPIVPVRQSAASGPFYEMLVRMESPDGTLLLPGAFMPAAERFNLMPAIDRWVIHAAVEQLRAGGNEDHSQDACPCVSVNLSAGSLKDMHLLHYISDCLGEYGVDPCQLCFEVAETSLYAGQSDAHDFLHELRGLGCRAALDGYGSGFGSFQGLDALPVDFIKIDASFTRRLLEDRTSATIVRSIAEIGALTGKQTIAENIEQQVIRDKLGELGVDFVQGYVTGLPSLFETRRAAGGGA